MRVYLLSAALLAAVTLAGILGYLNHEHSGQLRDIRSEHAVLAWCVYDSGTSDIRACSDRAISTLAIASGDAYSSE